MTRRSVFLIAAVSATIWSGAALAVYQETSITVTDKGTPVPGQTVVLTEKHKDPQRPHKKPTIKHLVKHKTNKEGKFAFKYDDKNNRPDIVYDLTLITADGRSRTMRDVTFSTVIAGGSFDFTNVPLTSETAYEAQIAQTVQPVSYVPSGWTFVIGANVGGGQSWNHYGNIPVFDGDGWGAGGFVAARYNFGSGWFAGPEAGGMALGVNGKNPDGAFSKIRWMAYEGGQVGYAFRTPGTTPINVYVGAGASQAGYQVGIDAKGFFDSMSKTLDGWSAHAGIEVQPAPYAVPNLWIGVDYRYSYWRGTIGEDAVSGGVHFVSAAVSYQFPAGN